MGWREGGREGGAGGEGGGGRRRLVVCKFWEEPLLQQRGPVWSKEVEVRPRVVLSVCIMRPQEDGGAMYTAGCEPVSAWESHLNCLRAVGVWACVCAYIH